jgi:hypothetical protein
MKPSEVYGAKTLSRLYLIPAIFLLLSGGGLLACRILLGYPFISFFLFFVWLGSLYTFYLSLYERNFRYRTLCNIEGKDVLATIDHVDRASGQISLHVMATYQEGDALIQGRLYGSFFGHFKDRYPDGTLVKVRLLKTNEFLLYADQSGISPQNPA